MTPDDEAKAKLEADRKKQEFKAKLNAKLATGGLTKAPIKGATEMGGNIAGESTRKSSIAEQVRGAGGKGFEAATAKIKEAKGAVARKASTLLARASSSAAEESPPASSPRPTEQILTEGQITDEVRQSLIQRIAKNINNLDYDVQKEKQLIGKYRSLLETDADVKDMLNTLCRIIIGRLDSKTRSGIYSAVNDIDIINSDEIERFIDALSNKIKAAADTKRKSATTESPSAPPLPPRPAAGPNQKPGRTSFDV